LSIEKKYHTAINDLIIYLKNSKFLTDQRVESALRNIPRHEFVPESELDYANGWMLEMDKKF
jgi:protein-L-isoaspartate O-methyltransferase